MQKGIKCFPIIHKTLAKTCYLLILSGINLMIKAQNAACDQMNKTFGEDA